MTMTVVIFGLIIIFNGLAFTAYAFYFSAECDDRGKSKQNANSAGVVS
jgi:hypothetical protein